MNTWITISIALILLTVLILRIRAAYQKLDHLGKEEPNRQEMASESEMQLSNSDFLTGCGVSEDSQEAETALTIRRELASAVTEWIKPFKTENILPDMTCRELMHGWNPQMWYNEGLDSIGFAVIRKIVKHHSLPRQAFTLLIEPEENPEITIKELIRNYVNVIMQYKRTEKRLLKPVS